MANDALLILNNATIPQKRMFFDKFMISNDKTFLATFGGSNWVFSEFKKWVNSLDYVESVGSVAKKWSEISAKWKKNRLSEISKGEDTLRPLSDSLLFIAYREDPTKIISIDSSGDIQSTEELFIGGSGAYLVHDMLTNTEILLDINATLEVCLKNIVTIYERSSLDLYVSGFPSLAIIHKGKILNLAGECERIWRDRKQNVLGQISSMSILYLGEC